MNKEEMEHFHLIRRRSVVGAALIFIGALLVIGIGTMLTGFVAGGILSIQGYSGMALTEKIKEEAFLMRLKECASVLNAVVLILWCGILYRKSSWREPLDYKKVFAKRHLLQIFCVGFCGCMFALLLLTMFQYFFPAFFQDYMVKMSHLKQGSALLFLYTLLLGPAAEELVFRGAIFDRLYLAFPFWIANGIQAALFALYHGNLIQGIYAFLFGLLLGMAHHTGKSIWNNILVHICFNVTNFIAPVLVQSGDGISVVRAVLCFCLAMAGLVYGILDMRREICGME